MRFLDFYGFLRDVYDFFGFFLDFQRLLDLKKKILTFFWIKEKEKVTIKSS